jgi:DNA primase
MFPIIDVRGNVIAVGGRTFKNDKYTAKYLNSPESMIFNERKLLLRLHLAKKSNENSLILVEGNIDVVALHQYGFDNAVASLGTSLTDEQAALITRYAEQVILIYDGDQAGQNATKRAIPILEKAGLQVKVLQLRDAKDPDEFLKKFGADKFKLLLEESSNRVEYQLNAIRRKYDIGIDDQRVKYLQESADLISTLPSAIQREVYAGRVAETAKISMETMSMEIKRAIKRRQAMDKKKQEAIDLAPAKALQPKSRTIRYDNMKSAMAEECVIALALREPALLDLAEDLEPETFSAPLLGNIYGQLRRRHKLGLDVSLAVLEELTSEEASHAASITQRQEGPVSEQAFLDCIRTIRAEHQAAKITSEDDLLAYQNKLKKSKGMKA